MTDIKDLLDLNRYPLDKPGTPEWNALVADCRAALESDGLFNLRQFVRADVAAEAAEELKPILAEKSHTHAREHNIYFRPKIEGLSEDHPALKKFRTVSHTICADQMGDALVVKLYEWPPFIRFVAAVMGKEQLFPMEDALARVNVMGYREGECLNWHFDRSEFTMTLLLQAPEGGGDFEYAKELRSADDPNYDGVAQLLAGNLPTVIMPLEAGTLNIFRGKNTAHRVTPVRGDRDRIIAVFSYFDRPGVLFTPEERIGFYGRAA